MSWTLQFLTDFKKILDFVFFQKGLSIFGVATWFPFDKGQSIVQSILTKSIEILILLTAFVVLMYFPHVLIFQNFENICTVKPSCSYCISLKYICFEIIAYLEKENKY